MRRPECGNPNLELVDALGSVNLYPFTHFFRSSFLFLRILFLSSEIVLLGKRNDLDAPNEMLRRISTLGNSSTVSFSVFGAEVLYSKRFPPHNTAIFHTYRKVVLK